MIILLFIAILDYLAIASDAISDSGINRKVNVSRRDWHFFKWLRYYIPQVVIFYLLYRCGLIQLSEYWLIGIFSYIGFGWIIWKLFYKSNILETQYDDYDDSFGR